MQARGAPRRPVEPLASAAAAALQGVLSATTGSCPPLFTALQRDLLAWYDRARRVLPWRALPGEHADPYRVWLSEIMLQQTTVQAVIPYYARFLERFPTVEALALAPLEEVLPLWAGLGYYARARNLHACARELVAQHGGRFPRDFAALKALPGIGDYTAAAIAAIAFDQPAAPVDGNWERVVARLQAVTTPLPTAKPALKAIADELMPTARAGDFAQAVMDLGATVCTPAKPRCLLCPLQPHCKATALGLAEALPARLPKAERPTRHGAVFHLWRADGAVLLTRRPPKGLLGGMMELPGTPWLTRAPDEVAWLAHAPARSSWRRLPGTVGHTFTHFHLELGLYVAEQAAAAHEVPGEARWVDPADLGKEALPSLMTKVLKRTLASF